MPPKAAEKKPTTAGKAPAGKAPEKKVQSPLLRSNCAPDSNVVYRRLVRRLPLLVVRRRSVPRLEKRPTLHTSTKVGLIPTWLDSSLIQRSSQAGPP
jgi:hypothetical protein